MCNITTQKNITCQKETKDKVILLNNNLIDLYSNESQIYFALNNTYEMQRCCNGIDSYKLLQLRELR